MERIEQQNSLGKMNKQDGRAAPENSSAADVMERPANQRVSHFDLKTFLRLPLRKGWRTVRDYRLLCSSHLIDPDWYRNTYNDVRNAEFDPVLHYLLYGAREGRNPGPLFDGVSYLQSNRDVETAGINPLVHYLRYGRAEGRLAGPLDSLTRPDAPVSRRSNESIGFINTERRLWFFIGDTLEWLKSHSSYRRWAGHHRAAAGFTPP